MRIELLRAGAVRWSVEFSVPSVPTRETVALYGTLHEAILKTLLEPFHARQIGVSSRSVTSQLAFACQVGQPPTGQAGRISSWPVPAAGPLDKGPQFRSQDSKASCRMKKKSKPRFGAIGQHGSIAVVERLVLTLKQCIAQLLLVPLRRDKSRREPVVSPSADPRGLAGCAWY